jgi:hypothetical protein
MTYSDYSITIEEFEDFLKNKECEKLVQIWQDLLRRIKEEEILEEAKSKGFTLIDNPDLEEDEIALYKMIQVPSASNQLSEYLIDKLYPFVVCLKA